MQSQKRKKDNRDRNLWIIVVHALSSGQQGCCICLKHVDLTTFDSPLLSILSRLKVVCFMCCK